MARASNGGRTEESVGDALEKKSPQPQKKNVAAGGPSMYSPSKELGG